MLAGHWQQATKQGDLFVIGEILLAQAYPAAAGGNRGSDDRGKRSARLVAVGHQQKWRIGKRHRKLFVIPGRRVSGEPGIHNHEHNRIRSNVGTLRA